MILKAINIDGYYNMAPVVTTDPETGEESTSFYVIPISRTILRSRDGDHNEFTHNPDNEVDRIRLTESANFMALNPDHLQAVNESSSRRGIVVYVSDGEGELVEAGNLEEYLLAGKDKALIMDARGPGIYFKEENHV